MKKITLISHTYFVLFQFLDWKRLMKDPLVLQIALKT